MRDYEFYYTQDGSIGLYSYADDDVYHSKFGALTEAWEKFVLPTNIDTKLNTVDKIRVLDVCYGVCYNTKALMSYVINKNEKKFKQKNLIEKFFKKREKKINLDNYNETLDTNKIILKKDLLCAPIETEETDCLTSIHIDCLDINKDLIKISPLLKTIITPQEIFSRIVPKIFDCFDTYWCIRKFLARFALTFAPKNKKSITELLDLKFSNDYDEILREYRIHKFVHYIILNSLIKKYKNEYFDSNIKKFIRNKERKKFFDKSLINYAKYRANIGYKIISKVDLSSYLHNIYYDHLSRRYKRANFDNIQNLFDIKFYADDARKSILNINTQYDYIFLDAFTFSKAPELWTVEFMAELYNRLAPRGVLMTYSNSALVRNTFLENNFYVGKIYNEQSGKFIGTIASKDKSMIKYPLSNYEIGLCNTRAGIPYHDPTLSLSK